LGQPKPVVVVGGGGAGTPMTRSATGPPARGRRRLGWSEIRVLFFHTSDHFEYSATGQPASFGIGVIFLAPTVVVVECKIY
jgi:hypothetical protein